MKEEQHLRPYFSYSYEQVVSLLVSFVVCTDPLEPCRHGNPQISKDLLRLAKQQ